jgi:hypothetical protein
LGACEGFDAQALAFCYGPLNHLLLVIALSVLQITTAEYSYDTFQYFFHGVCSNKFCNILNDIYIVMKAT